MRTRLAFAVAVALIAITLMPRAGRAQGNYRSTPTGGRSALLGDTGIALGSDGSSPFLNPATIVRIHDASLAFSVNFLSFGVTKFSDWHQPGRVDTGRFGNVALDDASESTTRLDVLPSTLCLFFTVAGWGDPEDTAIVRSSRWVMAPKSGRQKLAACFATTEQEDVSLSAVGFSGAVPGGRTHSAESFTEAWRRVYVGPSYGVDLTDDLSLGVSLHGALTTYGFIRTSNAITSDVGGAPVTSTLDAAASGHSIDLDATIGATYRLRALTFGLVAKPPAIHLQGNYDATFHRQASVAGAGDAADLVTGSGNFRAQAPAHVGAGVGAVVGPLRAEVDGTYAFPNDEALLTNMHVDTTSVAGGVASTASNDVTYTGRARPVFDVAMGAEYFVTGTSSVLGGVMTDITSVPELSTTASVGTLHPSRLSRVGLSVGVGSYGDAGTILVGTQLSLGWGQALAVNPFVVPNEYAVVDTRTYGVLFVIAGSTSLRALRGAVESVREIVDKKKRENAPPPAVAPHVK